MGAMRNAYRICIAKPKVRDHSNLGVNGEDNRRVDLREVGWKGADWMHLRQNRDHWRGLVNAAINLRVP
jgi:hypothetical protein